MYCSTYVDIFAGGDIPLYIVLGQNYVGVGLCIYFQRRHANNKFRGGAGRPEPSNLQQVTFT